MSILFEKQLWYTLGGTPPASIERTMIGAIVHGEENKSEIVGEGPTPAAIALIPKLRKLLDLEYASPSAAGFTEGYKSFNTSFP